MPGELSSIYKRIGMVKAHIKFLTRCSKAKLIPEGFFSKPRIHTSKAEHLEERFARIRMREQLNHLHAKLFRLSLDC
jgi:hypothetical protein